MSMRRSKPRPATASVPRFAFEVIDVGIRLKVHSTVLWYSTDPHMAGYFVHSIDSEPTISKMWSLPEYAAGEVPLPQSLEAAIRVGSMCLQNMRSRCPGPRVLLPLLGLSIYAAGYLYSHRNSARLLSA